MGVKARQFIILYSAGMAGVLSFLLVDLNSLIQMIPVAVGWERPTVTPLFQIASLIQPSVLLAIAVVVGVVLAPRVGLSAPVAEAIAGRNEIWKAAQPQIVPGFLGGLAGGLLILLIAYVSRSYLSAEVVQKSEEFSALLPLATRLLYGGITEELLLRWGFLTVLVWASWRIFQKGDETPRPIFFILAIILSSVVFGLGHLPMAYLLFPYAGPMLTAFVVSANSVFGLIAGFLYWRKGLESAILAHMFAHLVMFAAMTVAR
ncbi:MAG TPA: CPBP family intramembrane glutamic endopeptidase [Pyrinomonadaceae bacterium]